MSECKIKNNSILNIYFEKFKKRGQIIFSNEHDIFIFKRLLEIKNFYCFETEILNKNTIMFSLPYFFPHYLKDEYSPETCFSFN